jgi:LacI family transcriptional regulator
MASKKPTIQMVADLAGVSRGTVDRVLNNRSHVRPEICEKVMVALTETGYLTPRHNYQKTILSQNFMPLKLGVLLPNWSGHFKWEIIRGIESAQIELSDFNVKIIMEESQTDIPDNIIQKIDSLLNQGAQGIALCTINDISIERKISELHEAKIPVITYNSDIPNSKRLCFVGQDYNKSGRIAAELINKCVPTTGKILTAVGNLEFDGHRARLNGFITRMEEIGIPEDQITVIETYNDYPLTFRKVQEALLKDEEIVAIYMANRSVAGCINAIKSVEKKGNIHVVCHDISEHTKSFLINGDIDFSISQDLFHQGYLPLMYLRDCLHKNIVPKNPDTNTNISIICSQNL